MGEWAQFHYHSSIYSLPADFFPRYSKKQNEKEAAMRIQHPRRILFFALFLFLSSACSSDETKKDDAAPPADGNYAGDSNARIDSNVGADSKSGSDSKEKADSKIGPAGTRIIAMLKAPTGFKATPTMMAVSAYKKWPPVTKPDHIISMILSGITLTESTAYKLDITALDTIKGDYYLSIFVYVKGGGTTMPKNGIDYYTSYPSPTAPQQIPFDGKIKDLGTLTLKLYP
jgi:hypothetical protein